MGCVEHPQFFLEFPGARAHPGHTHQTEFSRSPRLQKKNFFFHSSQKEQEELPAQFSSYHLQQAENKSGSAASHLIPGTVCLPAGPAENRPPSLRHCPLSGDFCPNRRTTGPETRQRKPQASPGGQVRLHHQGRRQTRCAAMNLGRLTGHRCPCGFLLSETQINITILNLKKIFCPWM